MKVQLRGDEVEMTTPPPGPLAIRLGATSPTAPGTTRDCRAAEATLRANRRGILRFP